jgi:lipopolysaccharide/colanic/teichoic acid biosynthesis glycosyltransferase
MRSIYPASKRAFDVVASGLGLIGLAPVLGACALAVKMSSPGPVLFGHERVGLAGRRFKVLKFRSMTPIGRVLRRYKLDELPQLINVLRGDMSLVGPRPEVARYVERYPDAYARILQVRPGITDLAAIEYRDEEQLLAAATDPEQVYVSEILPAKIRLYDAYLEQRSLLMDAKILMRTLAAVIR